MRGVSVSGNFPGCHSGWSCAPGLAGKPPLPNGSTSRQQPRAAATSSVAHGEPDEVGSNDVGDTEDVGSDEVAADDDVGPDDEWPALQPTVTSTSNEAAPLRALRIPMPHLQGRGRRLSYTGDGDGVPRHPCWL